MTVKNHIDLYGWEFAKTADTSTPWHAMTVDIGFIDPKGNPDETEFTIMAYDTWELSQCFRHFCKENRFKTNSVKYITVVACHETLAGDYENNEIFAYNGYHFRGVRTLTNREKKMPLDQFCKYLYTEKQLLMTNYPAGFLGPNQTPYDSKEFYTASGNSEMDIFRCIETELLYIPGEHELFGWIEAGDTYYHKGRGYRYHTERR